MLTLLSPAKKLLTLPEDCPYKTTQPVLIKKAIELAKIMKGQSIEHIAQLMDLSQNLAALNYQRYQDFILKEDPKAGFYPALFIFQGDVYQGLEAVSWSKSTVEYSQEHLRILSGLYGLLKPLDKIQPYRLEMGVRLANPCGNTLYEFWRKSVTAALNQQLASQNNPLLLNLASAEYFKVVEEKQLNYPVITVNFYERANNEIKMIGIYAKKARGMMAQFVMRHQVDTIEGLKEFNESGYHFSQASSAQQHLDFVRDH